MADAVNDALAAAGIDERVDHRSFVDQGRENEIPEIHLGPAGAHAGDGYDERRQINEEIRAHNRAIRDARDMSKALDERVHDTAAHLNEIRSEAAIASAAQAVSSLTSLVDDAKRYRLSDYEIAMREIEVARQMSEASLRMIETLLAGLTMIGGIAIGGAKVMERVAAERERIVIREEHVRQALEKTGCTSIEELAAKINRLRAELSEPDTQVAVKGMDMRTSEEILEEYKRLMDQVPEELRDQLQKEMEAIGHSDLDEDSFDEALQRVDSMIEGFDEEGEVLHEGLRR